MTAAEKLRMEIAQEAPFSKDEFISKISRHRRQVGKVRRAPVQGRRKLHHMA